MKYLRGDFGHTAIWREIAEALMASASAAGYPRIPCDLLLKAADLMLADMAKLFGSGSRDRTNCCLARIALDLNPKARGALIRAARGK